MAAPVSGYRDAHQALQQILQSKLFHTPKQPTPWWMRVLKWIGNHLHLNLTAHALRDVGFALVGVCIIILVSAAVVVWRILHQRAKGRSIRVDVRPNATALPLDEASAAYAVADYPQMLHFLVEAMLVRAAFAKWVRLRPSKTLRAYSRELSRSENPLTGVFQRTAKMAEAVWFAQQAISEEDAKHLLDEVRSALLPEGVEAS